MRVPLSRSALALLCALTLNLAACVKPPAGGDIVPPTPVAASSFTLYTVDLATNDVRAVNPATGKTTAIIPVGAAPSAIAFDSDYGYLGYTPKHAFVANTGDSTVSVIDPVSNAVVKTIPVCKGPRALLYHHDESGYQFIYVACGDGNVTVLNASALDYYEAGVVDTVHVGGAPVALAQCDGCTIYSFAALSSGGTLALVHYDLGKFVLAQTLPVQPNPLTVAENQASYFVASSDGLVNGYSNGNDSNPATPFALEEQNTSAHPFEAGSALLDSDLAVFSDDQNAKVQIFANAFTGTPGKSPLVGLVQTLSTGAGPQGAAAAVVTQGAGAGSYLFVANANADSVSEFESSGTSLAGTVSFTPSSTIALAAGTHPVALAIYYKGAVATPTPSPSPSASPTTTPSATPSPTPTPTPTPTATPVPQHVYIANYAGNDVAQYALPLSNASAPSLTFADSTPVGGPIGIAVNSAYVVTSHVTGSVYAYQQPVSASSTPMAVFGGSAIGLMTFDAQGNLWATSQNSSVVEYVPPFTNSTLESTSLTSGFTDSYGIAFDSTGNMYVSNGDSSADIVVYASPYTAPANTYVVPGTNVGLRGVAVSGSSLFVADVHNNLIYVYSLPLTTNVPADAFSATKPVGLAFDATGKLYVTSQGTSQVQIFNPPFNSGSVPAVTVTSGVNGAYGIATGP